MSTRQQAREALAARMVEAIGAAGPMRFLADPAVPLLAAELLIRDLLELGWTPPEDNEEQRVPPGHGPKAKALREKFMTSAPIEPDPLPWGSSCPRNRCHWTTRNEGYATRGEAMNALHKHLTIDHPKESQ